MLDETTREFDRGAQLDEIRERVRFHERMRFVTQMTIAENEATGETADAKRRDGADADTVEAARSNDADLRANERRFDAAAKHWQKVLDQHEERST